MFAATLLIASSSQLVADGLDPILLLRGQKVLGQEAFRYTYLRHEYQFANETNLKAFKKNPTRFAAQNGGACGRMGALSGKGSSVLYEVVDGKLYFFASENCRATFLKSPELFTSPGPTKTQSPFTSTSQAEKAWNKVLANHTPGRRPASIAWTEFTPYKVLGVDKMWKSHRYIGIDSKLAMWEEWEAGRSFFLRNGNRFAEGKPNEYFDVHPDERGELMEVLATGLPGFLLGYAKPLEFGVDTVTVRINQRVITAKIENDLIAGISYEDHEAGPLTKVELRFSSFDRFGGVLLPTQIERRTNGGAWSPAKKETSYRVDEAVPIVFSDVKKN